MFCTRDCVMKKDTHLINIYLKIHNKKTLTMDDLRYLAKYDPDCFEKTCQNVVYNIPEAKPIMDSVAPVASAAADSNAKLLPQLSEKHNIDIILDNIKLLESDMPTLYQVNADEVKSLLGNLYMELLFPHNDQYSFLEASSPLPAPSFDKKA